jgi:sensor histidine kinase YesM
MAILYALYGLFTAIYILITSQTTLVQQLFVPSHLVAFVFSLYLILDFWLRLKSGLRYYIIAGSLFFLAGAMVSMYYSLGLYAPGETALQPVPFQLGPIDFMKLGVLVEVLCFALGIGHRIRITYRQKAHAQRAYIQELKRNDALNRQIQQDLTEQVEKRSQEIVDKTRELEQERSARIKASLEQQLTRSQMTNLRLQMNPHFIFNALNSIRHLVLKKDFRTASAHIGDFARLLRLILQNTSQTNISLQDELDTLGLYLGFEQRRFGERLSYEITVGKGLNPDNVQIPPMLIQPFVENAVWHGLMHKKEPGKIWIELHRDKDHLQVQVRDNGIGRQKSQEIRGKRAGAEKSYGLSITKDRLALMERLKQGKGHFEVKDLVNEAGEPAGTQVDMCIPL